MTLPSRPSTTNGLPTPDSVTFRWATVTGIRPLQVRLDGDSQTVLASPDSLVGQPGIGSRVWVQFFNRRLIVLGVGDNNPGDPFGFDREPAGVVPFGEAGGDFPYYGTFGPVDGGLGWTGLAAPSGGGRVGFALPWAGLVSQPYRVSGEFRIGRGFASTSSAGFLLLNRPVAGWVDGVSAGQQGWSFLHRRDATLDSYEYVGGAVASQIDHGDPVGTALPLDAEGWVQFAVQVGPTTIDLWGSGAYGAQHRSFAHSRDFGPLYPGVRFSCQGAVRHLSVVTL